MAFVRRFLHIQPIRSGLIRVTSCTRAQTNAGKSCKYNYSARSANDCIFSPAHFPATVACTFLYTISYQTCISYLVVKVITLSCVSVLAAAAAPEVYTVIPPQPSEKKPGQLEQWQLEEFFDKGFVQVDRFFTKDELQPAIKVKLFSWSCFINVAYSPTNTHTHTHSHVGKHTYTHTPTHTHPHTLYMYIQNIIVLVRA